MDRIVGENEYLQESYAQAAAAIVALQAEDRGWEALNFQEQNKSFALRDIKEIAEKARFQSHGNPLLKRGFTLRSSFIWGRGVEFVGKIPPRVQQTIDLNWDVLFSQQAFTICERTLFTDGNHFMAVRRSTRRAFPIPLAEITNIAANPDRGADIWYFERTYYRVNPDGSNQQNPTIEWYPVLETVENATARNPLLVRINDHPVISDVVVIDTRPTRDVQQVWSAPDVLPAMPYAWAHAEYLRDGSKLLKALSTIAWKVVSKSKSNAVNAGAKMATAGGRVAQTANMTSDTDLVAMPKAGQVDLGDGDRIASYVASALGVSLTALLSTAGASGGSFGAEASLEPSTQNDALARQAIWLDYFKRVMRALGIPKEITVRFRQISADPAYRTLQGLTIAYNNGGIHQEEYRAAILEHMDIQSLKDELPEPNEFTGAKSTNPDLATNNTVKIAQMQIDAQKANLQTQVRAQKAAAAAAPATANGGQGQSTGVGKISDGDNSARDSQTKPGTKGVNT
jgi:hypothetical protein